MLSDFLQQLLLALLPNEPVYYIGGSEVLPPPLSREAEDAALTALCAGDTVPLSVSISEKPATTTPSVLICTPTTCPPTTSSCAKAGTVSTVASSSDHRPVTIAFFIKISLPADNISQDNYVPGGRN